MANKQVGVVGLGKMGANIARNALRSQWEVVAYNRTATVTEELVPEGIQPAYTLKELVDHLAAPRVVWVMLTAGKPVDSVLFGEAGSEALFDLLQPGDLVVEAGNSRYQDAVRRQEKLATRGIGFMDVGVSGGPAGALNGACLMIGGQTADFQRLEPLFQDLALNRTSYQHFPGYGAGHFAKMVHNGIEYGMMQALAEGMEVLKKSAYAYHLQDVAAIYNKGSVIESRLVGWLQSGYAQYGEDLADISSTVGFTGEGEWTVEAAEALGVPVPIIAGSLQFRRDSASHPSYTGKVLSALRNQFGGHAAQDKKA